MIPKFYYFIDKFNTNEIIKLDKNIALIYRNYNIKYDIKQIAKIKDFTKRNKRKLFIANNLKLAIQLRLDGVYIPSFNKNLFFKNLNIHKKFLIIGSAHNSIEIINKQKQGCKAIFISPIFKNKKNKFFLDIKRYNIITRLIKTKIIALGGINSSNLKRLNVTNSYGYASITWIKKNRPKKLGRF